MTIRNVLLFPLEKDVAKAKWAVMAVVHRYVYDGKVKGCRGALAGVVLCCAMQGAAAMGQGWADPPPNNGSVRVAMNKAQRVTTTAPFDFWDVNELWEPGQ